MLILLISLSGCQIIHIAPYDPGEYWLVSSLRAQAMTNDCSEPAKDRLHELATHLVVHSQGLPYNEPQVHLNQDLAKIVDELWSSPNPSPYYCAATLKTIARMAEHLQKITGSKSR